MREHAIPQDISGYRFHIIGDMTLKQFAELAVGFVIAFLIYQTNLFPIIKWPLIVISASLGALAAFVPIEERPIDHWITTFVKILYKPTKYFWKREPHIPSAFLYEPATDQSQLLDDVDLSPARRARIKEYMRSVDSVDVLDAFDQSERDRLSGLESVFGNVQVSTSEVRTNKRPTLVIQPRALKTAGWFADQPLEEAFQSSQIYVPTQWQTEDANHATEPSSSIKGQSLNLGLVAQDIQIPEIEAVKIEAAEEAMADQLLNANLQGDRVYVENTSPEDQALSGTAAVTSADLPFPLPPTEANKVVGMVLTPHNDLVNDAIVEIKTTDGQVVRAVKTNALGQFYITTPLKENTYIITIDKSGLSFPNYELSVTGSVIAPLELRSL